MLPVTATHRHIPRSSTRVKQETSNMPFRLILAAALIWPGWLSVSVAAEPTPELSADPARDAVEAETSAPPLLDNTEASLGLEPLQGDTPAEGSSGALEIPRAPGAKAAPGPTPLGLCDGT
jgi:hypothetical protein